MKRSTADCAATAIAMRTSDRAGGGRTSGAIFPDYSFLPTFFPMPFLWEDF